MVVLSLLRPGMAAVIGHIYDGPLTYMPYQRALCSQEWLL
jgi:hypothetical protein